MRRVAAAGAIAAIAATVLIAVAAGSIRLGPPADPSSLRWPHSSRGLEALLENYDGGDYAAIARDPSFARPEVFGTKGEAAYRAQRPLFGELAWAASLGNPDRVPVALATLSVLSAAFAVGALGVFLVRRRLSPFLALGVFALPGVPVAVYDMMGDLLLLALITVGLLAWEPGSRTRSRWAILAFTAAALTRETSLLVPAALVAVEVTRVGWRAAWPRVRCLCVPFVTYAAWIALIRLRFGALPFAARQGRLTAVPLGGVFDMLRDSPYRAAAPWFASGVALLVATIILGRRDRWFVTTIAFGFLGVFLGRYVWQRPEDFGRVLLPMYAYSAVIVASALRDRRAFVSLHRGRSPVRSRS
jgi:hypothetical protein